MDTCFSVLFLEQKPLCPYILVQTWCCFGAILFGAIFEVISQRDSFKKSKKGSLESNISPNLLQSCYLKGYTPKTNMTMEKQPVEDVSPIRNGDFPLSFRGCMRWIYAD